ncbi:MAG: LPS export ABC transporter periplasmic protein LptC [Armatimonadetes bacterium]|nr:LPS export ABC transporter periplasmic protein LptC [Armatimonadota bacterium]MDW8027515.1 LPS export ABC transporter periplasmic protein LptC [Armatimonadota bacterium]
MKQENWLFLSFGVLLLLLMIAWWLALTISGNSQSLKQDLTAQQVEGKETMEVKGGQLVAEIPERKEKWTLLFNTSRYEPNEQVAVTQEGICQVTRNGKVITIFQAPTIIVRFKEREMEMDGGVTAVAAMPKLILKLQTLKWNWEKGKLTGKGKVKIDGENFSATAERLEGDTELMQFSLKGNAKLDWRSKSGERK